MQLINGDNTVPLTSSNIKAKENYYVSGYEHSELPSANGVPQDILSIIQNGSTTADYINVSTNTDICKVSGKSISVHSPVSLDIYDENNNHTGIASDGNIEYGISGVSFDEINGEKFAFIPDGTNYKIVLDGESAGTFDLNIEDVSGTDTISNEQEWLNVSIEGTSSIFQIDIGTSSENIIQVDENGDGSYENNLSDGYDGLLNASATSSKRRRHSVINSEEATTSSNVISEFDQSSSVFASLAKQSSVTDHIGTSSSLPVFANEVKQSRLISVTKNTKTKPAPIISTSSKQPSIGTASVYESGATKILKSIWNTIINFIKKII